MQNNDSMEAAAMVASEWRAILEYDRDLIDPAMVRAAYAQPRLQELFPRVSHGILHLSRCTGFPSSHDIPLVYPLVKGGFQVSGTSDTGILGEVATLEEAFALVAVNLPEGCGPAIIGTANDL
ncbi:DUF6193 family natural product biosynthesis protein [Streptomyces xantholiticus]|uniref:DUF6193 family natural product biosynthesis protein n=1 Tax=Streptomyces xantholiticus TaxID=68285 RepID=UPI001677AC18|nr:DUF6193 family natural product biosynthesis protein [Streptomyces xantholiticus]